MAGTFRERRRCVVRRLCVGQTNITEIDPIRYDIDWWRGQWRRTRVQGISSTLAGSCVLP